MGTLAALESEKADLSRAVKMFETLSREHRIDISARIDAYYRDEMLNAGEQAKQMEGKRGES